MLDRFLKQLVLRRYRDFAPVLDLAGAAYADAMLGYDALDRRSRAVQEEVERELGRVLGSRNVFELWSHAKAFEGEFAAWCGKRFAIGTSSCTAALQLSLVAAGVGPGDEVITSAHTFVATALAIHNTGARPVLVDPDADSLCMGARAVEQAVGPRTRAVVPVHMHGHPVDMAPILDVAHRRGLVVIEDCAQAPGAARDGRKVPLGSTGCFSFFPTKPLGGAGNGGMIVTDDEGLAARLEKARDPEGSDPVVLAAARTPCYLNAMEVAVLRARLPHAVEWSTARQRLAARYLDACHDLDPVAPGGEAGARSAWNSFVVRVPDRDQVKRRMFLSLVETRIEYCPAFFESPTFAALGWRPGDYPVALDASRRGLSLPIHPYLTEAEQTRVIRALHRALGR